MKKALIRSTFLGTAGILMILVGGTILPTPQLQFWGLPIFLAGLLLISLGLIPHRRLTHLEKNPSELWFDGETLTFFREHKRIFQIPLAAIDKIQYLENSQSYGWGIRFKRPLIPFLRNKDTKTGHETCQILTIVSKLIFLNMNKKGSPEDGEFRWREFVSLFLRIGITPLSLEKAAPLAAHPFEGSDLFLPYFTERAWKEWNVL